MPHAGIHARSSWNCIPPVGTNAHHSGTEIANSTSVATRVMCFAHRAGPSSTGTAASAGQTISAVSTTCWYMPLLSLPLPRRHAEHGQHPDHEQHDVESHFSGLQAATH